MAFAATSALHCPLYSTLPLKESVDHEVYDDWCQVVLMKRNDQGAIISLNDPLKFTYTLQQSTGDLYGLKEPESQFPSFVALKASFIGVAASFYALGIMGANFIKIAIDISSIFWRVIPQFVCELSKSGPIPALGNAFMAITWEIPTSIAHDVWRIYRSPIYAIGMIFASMLTVISPMAGRKWLGEIEWNWHEGTPLCNQKAITQIFDQSLTKHISDFALGKVLYLSYCMQKQGNLNDRVCGVTPKYEYYRKL